MNTNNSIPTSTTTVTSAPETTLPSSRNATAASSVATADQKKTKGAWWRNDEDQLLVQAYLLINKDEKVGINQDSKTFWQRVFEEFEKGGNDKNRTPESCQGRWEIISAQIARYAAAVAFIERGPPKSGEADDDKKQRIVERYNSKAEARYKPFKMAHCWPLLKNEQKFKFVSDKANEVSVDGEKDVRPLGNKKAKALKRRHAEDDDLASLADEQVKLARLEVVEEEKRRRLLEEMLKEAQKANEEARLAREEAIMSKDLDSLSPAQRWYFEKKQQEIVDRLKEETEKDVVQEGESGDCSEEECE